MYTAHVHRVLPQTPITRHVTWIGDSGVTSAGTLGSAKMAYLRTVLSAKMTIARRVCLNVVKKDDGFITGCANATTEAHHNLNLSSLLPRTSFASSHSKTTDLYENLLSSAKQSVKSTYVSTCNATKTADNSYSVLGTSPLNPVIQQLPSSRPPVRKVSGKS
jgi:hypothetical protein